MWISSVHCSHLVVTVYKDGLVTVDLQHHTDDATEYSTIVSNLCLFCQPVQALCGLRGCKNGPAPFPGRMSYKATKPGLVFVLYLSMFFIVLVFIRAPFYVQLVFIVCVVCLLVVLVKLSLLAKLLARKTPLSSDVHLPFSNGGPAT